jgi:hypothetical protein
MLLFIVHLPAATAAFTLSTTVVVIFDTAVVIKPQAQRGKPHSYRTCNCFRAS